VTPRVSFLDRLPSPWLAAPRVGRPAPGERKPAAQGDNEARARAAGFGVPSPTTSADHTSRPVPVPRFLSAGAEPAARPVAGGGRGEKFKRWGPSYFTREELERPTFAC